MTQVLQVIWSVHGTVSSVCVYVCVRLKMQFDKLKNSQIKQLELHFNIFVFI